MEDLSLKAVKTALEYLTSTIKYGKANERIEASDALHRLLQTNLVQTYAHKGDLIVHTE